MPAPKGEGKKPKVSKKEQLLLEQQRLVEEAQKAEEAELQRQANEEKRAREEEQQKALKLQQEREEETLRLLEQARRDHRYLNRQQQQLSHLHATIEQQHEWQRYLECNPLPDVRHEAELNTYLSLWREAPAASAQPDMLLQSVVNSCSVSESIVSSLHDAASLAREDHDSSAQQFLTSYQHTLRHLTTAKVDQLTSAYLTHSDLYEDDQRTFQLSHHSPHIDYALWVHTSAKHGRVKRIEWPDIGMTVELPVALQQSRVAIRVVRTTFDHVSEREEAEDDMQTGEHEASGEEAAARKEEREREREVRRAMRPPHHFVSVGGMICIEQLALPPPPKQAKGWAMRELAHTCSALQVIPYPTEDNTQTAAATGAGAVAPAAAAAAAAASAAQTNAPLRLSFYIPASVYLPQQMPHFGWYDVNAHAWRQDGISLVSFDSTTRLTQLALSSLHPIALIQPRALDFPYRQWYLHTHDNSTELLLKGSRYDAVVEVKGAAKPVDGGVCRLVSPAHPLLSAINDQWHPPGRLLLLARELGINLAPTADDGDYCRKPRKREELVEAVHGHLAAVVSVFDVGGMEMNGGRGERTLMLKVRLSKSGVELAGSLDKKRRWEERREADEWYRQEKEEEAARLREEKTNDAAQEQKEQPDGGDSDDDELELRTDEQKRKEFEESKQKDEQADKAKAETKDKQVAATQPLQPTTADSSQPAESVAQKRERGQQWHTVMVTLTDIDGSAIDAEAAEQSSTTLPYGTIAEHVPGGHHLLRFVLVRGATNGQVDLTPLTGCMPHSSLRRCLHAHFKGAGG